MLREGSLPESDLSGNYNEIIYELNKISPELNLFILPQYEEDLQVDNDSTREEAVLLLAKLFSTQKGLAQAYPVLFASFLKRFNDRSATIRSYLIEFAKRYLTGDFGEETSAIENGLCTRMNELDDHIRRAAINAVIDILKSTPERLQKSTIEVLAHRILDKKAIIRKECIKKLGELYAGVCASRDYDPTTWPQKIMKNIGWIPSHLLAATTSLPADDVALVERVIDETILPDTKSVTKRAKATVKFFASLTGDEAVNAFQRLIGEREIVQKRVVALSQCFTQKEPFTSDAVQQHIEVLSNILVNERVKDHCKKLYKLKTAGKVFKQLEKMISPDVTKKESKGLIKGMSIMVSQYEAGFSDFIETLAEKVSFKIINPSVGRAVAKLVCDSVANEDNEEDEDSDNTEDAINFISTVSEAAPTIFASCLDVFLEQLTSLDDKFEETVLLLLSRCSGISHEKGAPLVKESEDSKRVLKLLVKKCKTAKHIKKVHEMIESIRVIASAGAYNSSITDLLNHFIKNAESTLTFISGIYFIMKQENEVISAQQLTSISKIKCDAKAAPGKHKEKYIHFFMKIQKELVKLCKSDKQRRQSMELLESFLDENNPIYKGVSKAAIVTLRTQCCKCICGAAGWLGEDTKFSLLERIATFMKEYPAGNREICKQICKTFAPVKFVALAAIGANALTEGGRLCRQYLNQTIALRLRRVSAMQKDEVGPIRIASMMPEYAFPYLMLLCSRLYCSGSQLELVSVTRTIQVFLSCFQKSVESLRLLLRIARGLSDATDAVDPAKTKLTQRAINAAMLQLEKLVSTTSKGDVFVPAGLFTHERNEMEKGVSGISEEVSEEVSKEKETDVNELDIEQGTIHQELITPIKKVSKRRRDSVPVENSPEKRHKKMSEVQLLQKKAESEQDTEQTMEKETTPTEDESTDNTEPRKKTSKRKASEASMSKRTSKTPTPKKQRSSALSNTKNKRKSKQ